MEQRNRCLFAALLLALSFCLRAGGATVESNLSHRRFTTNDGLPQMQTETVWQDSRGYIYFGTLSGFVRYDGRTMTPFLGGRRENIVAFQEVDGDIRAMGFVRQWTVRGKEVEMSPVDPEGQLLLNNLNASDLPPGFVLLEDRREENRVLCRLAADGYERILDSPLLDSMLPDRKMYVDSTGIYVPTLQGLYVSEGGQMRLVSRKTDVFSLIRCGAGLLALASDGIYNVGPDGLSLQYSFSFEAPDYGLFVRRNAQGQLVIADSHTIWRYDPDAGEPMRQLATGFNLIKAIFVDRWNRLWAATYQGVYCFFHCNFEGHRLTDKNDIVRAVAFSGENLVAGTLNGVIMSDWQVLDAPAGNFFAPGAVAVDGSVYMAGNGDVVCVRNGSRRWLGLPDDVYRFVSRAGRRLVIGTRSCLLACDPETSELDTLTTEIQRPWCAVEDNQGCLWVSGNPGLYCLSGYDGGDTQIRIVKSTPGPQIITAMAADGKGNICFARGDSLFCIRNGNVRAMTELQAVLSGHEIRSVHLSPRGYLVAAAIDGLLVSGFNGVDPAVGARWFNSDNGFTTIEPQMGPMAENEDGTIWLCGLEDMISFNPGSLLSDNQESTVIAAPRPWWQRPWIWLSGAALLVLLAWFVAGRYEKRQAGRKMAALEREKRQKDLQLQAVRLKSIPHFHSNVLSSIEYFIMNKSADDASHYLKLYSDFTNQTLSDIDRPSRSVAEEVEYIRSYLELERLRYGERLTYSIDVAPDVDRNFQLPTMLLHTYCQNAVKHGIASKIGEGSVVVTIRNQAENGADGVLVSVQDDGVGRTEAARSGGYSTGQGLKILGQQIELYNQANRLHIAQRVTDLTDADGHPAGTCFETWIPLDYNY